MKSLDLEQQLSTSLRVERWIKDGLGYEDIIVLLRYMGQPFHPQRIKEMVLGRPK